MMPYRTTMKTDRDLQSFIDRLEQDGELHRVTRTVSLVHEITQIHHRTLAASGPALLFERPVDAAGRISDVPVLVNLFGTRRRIEMGLGIAQDGLPGLGELLATLRQPEPPRNLTSATRMWPMLKAGLGMGTRTVTRPASQNRRYLGKAADLGMLPIQWCWPGEPAPLVTWPLVITRAPDDPTDINVGIYRMQVLGPRQLIVRWLAHRGGARHHCLWRNRGEPMPIAVAVGADPATILAAVMPLPDKVSELAFAGILRGSRTPVGKALTSDLPVPASAEIVIEGTVSPDQVADEGPYGDHTGYYNAVEPFPVMEVSAITMRERPVYLSTYTGRPPDEPSVLGEAMNELFIPLARRQFPEIVDLHLPPEACSYRTIVVAIDKRYPGQARGLMLGLWSMLPQFSYCKTIIVVDRDIDVRDWADVHWAIATRFDASRDLLVLDNTPIDYLDFASPLPGLGGKMGIDATGKIGSETVREWGRPLAMSQDVIARVDALWSELGLQGRTR
jgi:4-hydroxy-3-polyprenylbenzoate decarboxylase